MRKIILSSLLLTSFTAASAEALDDKNYKLSRALAECAGTYSAVSVIIKTDKTQNVVKQFEGLARGYKASASYLNYISGNMTFEKAGEWAESIEEVRKIDLLSRVELSTKDKIPEEVTQSLSLCKELSPLQIEIVEQIRKQIYTNK